MKDKVYFTFRKMKFMKHLKQKKHRQGCGYDERAPTGLMEHSGHYGPQMEQAFQSGFVNKFFDLLIKVTTSDRMLNIARHAAGGKIVKIPKILIDTLGMLIDRRLSSNPHKMKKVLLGRFSSSNYRSWMGGFIWEILRKYVGDWARRQEQNIVISPPIRKFGKLKKTYQGWKQLRDSVQPGWEVFPKDPKTTVKILPEDSMTPKERIERIIRGKEADRVGLWLDWDWGVPFMGGSNLWKFCYDGIETGWAAVNVWIRTGGSDWLPFSSGISAYTHPLPEAHSRFFFDWSYPSDTIPAQFHETELLKSYEDLYDYGLKGQALEITKRMIRDLALLPREMYYAFKVTNHYFGPYQKQFPPGVSAIFPVWDIIPMWRSVVPFMLDTKRNPEAIIEAFEYVNKPYTDFMIRVANLLKAKFALIGVSRGSNTFLSPKMFEKIFWPSMKYTFEQCFKNEIIPLCHLDNDWTENMVLFAEKLPKRSCIFHLDQVDLVKIHDLIGDHFCLMGGMSPSLLVQGSSEQVEAATKRYIENIGEDGLIISSGCEFPFDTPIQNVFAIKRAMKKFVA